MLKIDRAKKTFSALQTPTLRQAGVLERTDLQACILNSSSEFFAEFGMDLFTVGQEIRPSQDVDDRIDVLAIDREGAVVVVELKRGDNKLQMLQAISYAGMVARWSPDEFQALLSQPQWEQLTEFLDVDVAELNREQRILLVAEGYDYALLSGAEWLSERHGIDLRCCTVSLAVDATNGSEYLACASVYPPPALAEQSVARSGRTRRTESSRWKDWNHALDAVHNADVRQYFTEQLGAGRENKLNRRVLFYRVDGKRRWHLRGRSDRAYVWQNGRFDGDEDFWMKRLGDDARVTQVKRGRALSFRLSSPSHITAFHDAATTVLLPTEWVTSDEAM